MPSRVSRSGTSSSGLTMMTSEGFGVASIVVGQLADAAREQHPDVRLDHLARGPIVCRIHRSKAASSNGTSSERCWAD